MSDIESIGSEALLDANDQYLLDRSIANSWSYESAYLELEFGLEAIRMDRDIRMIDRFGPLAESLASESDWN